MAGVSGGNYYRGQNRSSVPNYSGIALPTASRIGSWAYGTASKDWENIQRRKVQLLNFLSSLQHPIERPVISDKMTDGEMIDCSVKQREQKEMVEIIELSDDENENIAGCTKLVPEINKQSADNSTYWMASDGKDQAYESMLAEGDKNTQIVPYDQSAALLNHLPLQTSWQPSIQFEKVVLQKRPEEARMQDLEAANIAEKKAETQVFLSFPMEKRQRGSDPTLHMKGNEDPAIVPKHRKRKCDPDPAAADFSFNLQKAGVSSETDMSFEEEENPRSESDGLEDYWNDFSVAVQSAKLEAVDETANDKDVASEKEEIDCNHDIRIHEDLGHVCRVCGMIVKRADSIIEYQWKKASRRRHNFYEGHSKEADEIDYDPVKLSEDFIVADIAIHPRHAKEMRSHQLEGFNFLVKNLVSDKPGGCILAHAPGSGKTFMIISFIQSFLARYPSARPLIVLPKFIVSHWKDEFQRWQVQDIPLYDFYSVKAEKRVEQLEILKSWESQMSILFLGYTQFSRIVSDDGGGNAAVACRDRLLKVPNLLILDEGHKPRNRDTNVLETLNRVETPRKVVLSEISEVNAEDRVNSLTDKSVDNMIDSVNFRDGVKARFFMNILSLAESAGEKLLAFSQYILPMKFLERLLVKMKGWHVGKEIFVISGDASSEDRDLAKDKFNSSADAKVLFGSIKACGEGISLVGASRVIILDVYLNPSVTRQAIGRAFRPEQQKKVFVYRLVAAESPEERSHETAFKKEVIPKLWFEWSEQCTTGDFKLDQIDVDDCGDEFLDNKAMRQDIKALYKRVLRLQT
ncbi:hypothetical protein PR202_gb23912 [Eleusine coracana subsp. coracana]|uniref:Helicase C-terminal domain-containing protein n=1 Tax=Eleusine coracana subsp. coracana TaxID=191504 RepID=A0AAV5FK06_ELECO|nr:hypothetical protein PR202_gb23912 [Eleusine coracana subsp. coracana]